MAERPIFVPDEKASGLVREMPFTLTWHSGFAPSQKQKNVKGLHDAAARAGFHDLLEISTKSERELGRRLSAFSLNLDSETYGVISLEAAFQGSKVFERGGPFTDLYALDARSAKHDPRLRSSGQLVRFEFDGCKFPLEPKTVFYDWLYINTLLPHREWLQRLEAFSGFTDTKFNPSKSINCQARSCALFVSLMRLDIDEDKLRSPKEFIALMKGYTRREDSMRGAPKMEQMHF